MMGEFGLLGVPFSAAAHGPGQEKAPAALRRAGLPERLAAAGVRVADYGDLPVVRWRPGWPRARARTPSRRHRAASHGRPRSASTGGRSRRRARSCSCRL
jgi:arginase family protein